MTRPVGKTPLTIAKGWLLGSLLLVATSVWAAPVWSPPAERDVPDPVAWLASLGKPATRPLHAMGLDGHSFRLAVLTAKDPDDGWSLSSIGVPLFLDSCCLKAVAPRDVAWTFKVNGLAPPQQPLPDGDAPPSRLGEVGALDLMVYLGDGDTPPQVWRRSPDGVSRIAVTAHPTLTPQARLQRVVMEALGYGGEVVAQQGTYVLVQGVGPLPPVGTQALALGGTEAEPLVKPSSGRGVALLQLVRSDGNVGVFQILIERGSAGVDVPVGTKVLIDEGAY